MFSGRFGCDISGQEIVFGTKILPKTTVGCILITAFAASGAQAATDTDTFDVTIEVTATCSVTAGGGSDIDLGTATSAETNISGNSDITINCSNSIPYYLGLAPSNSATTGAGEMSPAGASPDTVTYQLRSTSGASGTVWGDTATSSAVGNGVSGTGSGSDQTVTVYVTVPSANYVPDTYSDTVTLTVNY